MAVHWGGRGPGHVSRGGGLFASLRLDFLNNVSAIDPRITFTRASSATRVNASGLIETVSSNVARIDYDPVTLAAKGLLIEEQRTNLLLRSQEFDNASWGKNDTTVTADAATAPDGTATMDLLTEGSAGTASINQVATITANATVSLFFFLKRGNHDWVRMFAFDAGNSSNRITAWFNLGTGVAGAALSEGTATGATASVKSLGGGVYLCVLTGSVGNSATSLACQTASASANSVLTRVSGGTRYQWGAQLEAGSFATSYIPTTSATVTRAADVASITGTNFSDWFNPTEGTFVVESDSFVEVSTNLYRQFAATNAASTDQIHAFVYNGKWGGAVRVGGVDQCNLQQASSYTAGVVAKTALAYKTNDFACSVNGNTPIPDASGAIPTVDRLFIGSVNGSSSHTNGHIRRLTYYPARLSNALLASLTA